MNKIVVTRGLCTSITDQKIKKIADEAGVSASHIETRFAGKGKWLNDFEIAGSPGRVDAFFARIDDLRPE